MNAPRALIAEDEPVLAAHLASQLARLWPELHIGQPLGDGLSALAELEADTPDIAFLDIRMPGLTGLEVAARLSAEARETCCLVFVTAYDAHAVQAFELAAVDYVLKPASEDRLATTVRRLKQRMAARADSSGPGNAVPGGLQADALAALIQQLAGTTPAQRLRWIRAEQGQVARMISVDEVCYFQSDEKYTRVVTPTDDALIRVPLKELLAQLDPDAFWQVHRGTIVRVAAIDSWRRELTGGVRLHLRGRNEAIAVSRAYAHLFKGM